MKLLWTFLLVTSSALVWAQGKPVKFTLSTSFQQDDFQWSIAGNINGTSPNILSEVTWTNLRGPAVGATIRYAIRRQVLIQLSADGSLITAGRVNDSDYRGSNHTNPTRQDVLQSNRGYTLNYSAVAGYTIYVKRVSLSPYVGYSKNIQHMYLLDDQGLRSSYHAKWKGLVARVMISTKISEKISLEPAWAYYQLWYDAEADWNLVTAFAHPVSFTHTARGFGAETSLSVIFTLTKKVMPFFRFCYAYRVTGFGMDKLFYATGATALTRLNKAERRTILLQTGIHLFLPFGD